MKELLHDDYDKYIQNTSNWMDGEGSAFDTICGITFGWLFSQWRDETELFMPLSLHHHVNLMSLLLLVVYGIWPDGVLSIMIIDVEDGIGSLSSNPCWSSVSF